MRIFTWRGLRLLALAGIVLVVSLVLAALLLLQSDWLRNRLRDYIVAQSQTYLNAQLSVGRLSGSLVSGIVFHDVAIRQEGATVVGAERIVIGYSLRDLMGQGLVIDSLTLVRPEVSLVETRKGWNIARLVKEQAQEEEREGPARPIRVDRIEIVDGALRVTPCGAACGRMPAPFTVPRQLDDLDAQLSLAYQPVDVIVDVARLSFRARQPDLQLRRFSGRLAVVGDDIQLGRLALQTGGTDVRLDGTIKAYTRQPVADFELQASPLSLEEIGRFVPAAAGVNLRPRLTARVEGGLRDLRGRFAIDDSAGQANGNLRVRATGPTSALSGQVRLEHLNIGAILRNPDLASRITGAVRADLQVRDWTALETAKGTFAAEMGRSLVGPYHADSARLEGTVSDGRATIDGEARAYGSRLTAEGTVDLPARAGGALAFDLTGRADSVNLSRLPASLAVPRLATDVNGRYHVTSDGRRLSGDVRFARSAVEGGVIGAGAVARFALGNGETAYGFTGDLGEVNLRRLGSALHVQALDDPRFESSINGSVNLDGRGTTLSTMDVRAEARLRDSRLAEVVVPDLHVTGGVAAGAMQAEAAGSFSNLDPVRFGAGPNLVGRVQGTVAGQVTVADLSAPITAEAVTFKGGATILDSTIGNIALDRVSFRGQLSSGMAVVDALDVAGPALRVDASGPVALGASGDSNLRFKIEARDLAVIASTFGRQVTGMSLVEGTLRGNRSEYESAGTLTGNAIRYGGSVNLLQVNTKFAVRVPELDFARANGELHATSTLPVIAGRKLRTARADVTFGRSRVGFDVELAEANRTLASTGNVVVHTDHREIHVDRLALGTEKAQWQLQPGTSAAIRYGADRIEFEGLQLVSGTQRIGISGLYGLGDRAKSTLDARMERIDLASLGELLLMPEMNLSGTLDARAHVTGVGRMRSGSAEVTLSQGSVRGFTFLGATGSVKFDPVTARVDARVRQTESAALNVSGTFPAPALGITGTMRDTSGPLDIRVTANGLDLAVLEAMTGQVAKVTGAVTADIQVAGSVAQPRATGELALRDASFVVVSTGAAYQGVQGQLALHGDRLEVVDLQVLDDDRDPLRVRGELAVNGRRPGAFSLDVTAHRFEVIDNEMGDIDADLNLTLRGELAAPVVTGNVRVGSGRVEIDRVLEQLGSRPTAAPARAERISASGTATSQASAGTLTTAAAGSAAQPVPSPPAAPAPRTAANDTPAAGVALDVTVEIPDNLVVRGSHIQPANTPMSLGDVNVTLGGDFTVRKPATGDPVVAGAIRTVRGTYTFQGRRFTILRDGRVQFQGTTPPDPALDIAAEREISGILAQVRVRGTASKPTLSLTSDPPMEEAEVLALVVFNAPINQLTEGQRVSLGARAGALASGFVVSPLAESLGKALDIDVFEIRGFGADGSGPEITLGEQVGERLFVSFQQQLGVQEVSEFVLEYQLNEFLRLKGSLAEGDSRANRTLTRRVEQAGIDLVLLIRY